MTYNIKIFGIVQGVGFRPFVKNLADNFFISGTVANRGSYVEIFAQSSEKNLENFIDAIKKNSPPRSAILKLDFTKITDKNFSDFKIIESTHERGDIFVSPDISICENCQRELFDKNNRRYLHPFINCTACGPRLTILENMPYDRERTSMKNFPMCEKCSEEYFNKNSRRFDAQPICCNDCGPQIFLKNSPEKNLDAIKKIRKIIFDGGIVAIKGIGGFHLACDAKNFSAVQILREKKFRPQKPFAVMFKNISAVEKYCFLSETEKNFLDSPQKPIILLRKKNNYALSKNVAPEINKIGAFLPYTPLHLLIFDFPDEIKNFPDALIMTSLNFSGNPIEIDDDFEFDCDEILTHDRKILLRADDSVMDFIKNSPSMIRRSRGYAPLPIFIEKSKKISVLAIGGELKNSFSLAKNNLIYSSPYIGDAKNLKTLEILEKSIARMSDLLEISPEKIICDTHPRYQTVKFAEKISAEKNISLEKIQHHYAHILSNLAENNFFGEVIGVAMDGTGFGDDGTVWGGEFFICDAKNYRRVDKISKFLQAGGDKSSVDCWRSAISMMKDKNLAFEMKLTAEKNILAQKFLLEKNINCVESTSCGRLFDAVAAILKICEKNSYEGEAAMKLQSCAENFVGEVEVKNIFSTQELFDKILEKVLNGGEKNFLAKYFHEGLAEIIFEKILEISLREKIFTVALSGGVFQNIFLTEKILSKLSKTNLQVLLNKMIPANDGGISVGQAFFALQQ